MGVTFEKEDLEKIRDTFLKFKGDMTQKMFYLYAMPLSFSQRICSTSIPFTGTAITGVYIVKCGIGEGGHIQCIFIFGK